MVAEKHLFKFKMTHFGANHKPVNIFCSLEPKKVNIKKKKWVAVLFHEQGNKLES